MIPNPSPRQPIWLSEHQLGKDAMSNQYTVTWTVDVEVMGDHKDAAQAVADLYFQERIAAGEHGSACSFTVAGSDNYPVEIDLADSSSDLEGDDTQ